MSSDIILSKNDIKKIKSNNVIGRGSMGIIYDYKDDLIFKLYCEKLTNKYIKRLDKIVGIENDTFIFPKNIVKNENGKVIGIIEKKIDAPCMFDVTYSILEDYYDLSFESVCKLYENALKKIKDISNDNILIYDLHDENILVNDNFKFIDTDQYILDKKRSKLSIYNYNTCEMIDTILGEFRILNMSLAEEIEDMIGFNYEDESYIYNFLDEASKKLNSSSKENSSYTLKNFKNY